MEVLAFKNHLDELIRERDMWKAKYERLIAVNRAQVECVHAVEDAVERWHESLETATMTHRGY